MFSAANPIGAGKGDLVKVESETGPVLKAAVVLYVIPLVLFFLGYFVFESLCGAGVPAALMGFLLGVLIAVLVGRGQKKRGKEITFRIVSFVNE